MTVEAVAAKTRALDVEGVTLDSSANLVQMTVGGENSERWSFSEHELIVPIDGKQINRACGNELYNTLHFVVA